MAAALPKSVDSKLTLPPMPPDPPNSPPGNMDDSYGNDLRLAKGNCGGDDLGPTSGKENVFSAMQVAASLLWLNWSLLKLQRL